MEKWEGKDQWEREMGLRERWRNEHLLRTYYEPMMMRL